MDSIPCRKIMAYFALHSRSRHTSSTAPALPMLVSCHCYCCTSKNRFVGIRPPPCFVPLMPSSKHMETRRYYPSGAHYLRGGATIFSGTRFLLARKCHWPRPFVGTTSDLNS